MNHAQCDAFLGFFYDYASHYRELLSFELEKLRLISEDDVKGLNASLSKEQALMMRGNAFEKKREKLLDELSLGGKSFQDITDLAPDEQKAAMQACQKEFTELVLEIKRVNDGTMEVVKIKLRQMEERSRLHGEDYASDMYNGKGAKNAKVGTSTMIKDI